MALHLGPYHAPKNENSTGIRKASNLGAAFNAAASEGIPDAVYQLELLWQEVREAVPHAGPRPVPSPICTVAVSGTPTRVRDYADSNNCFRMM